MKKITNLILTILLISSCGSKSQEELQKEFIKSAGVENHSITIDLINNLEKNLSIKYQKESLSENYISYLEDIKKNGLPSFDFSKKDCELFLEYQYSDFDDGYIKVEFDTIFFDNENILLMIFEGDTIRGYNKTKDSLSKKDIILSEKEKGFIKINPGKILEALETISKQNSLISEYTELRRLTTRRTFPKEIYPSWIGNHFLKEKVNVSNNYFYKIILISEIYYKQMKKYGC
ncbi:MAG: hypothetical protein AB8H03_01895 [Saprospiraceae bacterium]